MTIQQSFDRIAILKVLARKPENFVLRNIDNQGTQYPSKMPDGSPGFRIRFNIEKVIPPVPVANNSTIQIYNLGPDSRNFVMRQYNKVILEAGYGQQAQIVIAGTIMWCKTQKEGPDYVTTLNVQDGGFAFQNTFLEKSYKKGTKIQNIINDMIDEMEDAGIGRGTIKGVPNQSINQSFAVSGLVVQNLKQLCERLNLQFSIQNENVVIVPYGATNGIQRILLSPDTGLIGIPEVRGAGLASPLLGAAQPSTQEDLTRNTSLVAFKCLMNPQLENHQQIEIQSKFVNGTYTIVKLNHRGDSFGGEWYSEGEAT